MMSNVDSKMTVFAAAGEYKVPYAEKQKKNVKVAKAPKGVQEAKGRGAAFAGVGYTVS
jgi:hypothetical protein|tara:strand:+ start:180 stop:353 length:174 start_codon:yes stop_codon:yes gene_type:complete